jgi:hypothetical protein
MYGNLIQNRDRKVSAFPLEFSIFSMKKYFSLDPSATALIFLISDNFK